jgi:LysR family hydrogen peroxide-inducible transcriptional activator
MNFQQMEYLVALDKHRNFVAAAEACFVSQPTLSMMIKKLEEELDLTLIHRGVQPLQFTDEGELIVVQAKRILAEQRMMKDLSKELVKGLSGHIRLGVIPSLAPRVVPSFIRNVEHSNDRITFDVSETPTAVALELLLNGELEMAVLATEVDEEVYGHVELYSEAFVAYVHPNEKLPATKFIQPKHLDVEKMWFLSEEHCFREQAMEICSFKGKRKHPVKYQAGSLISLIRLVDANGGMTILPVGTIEHLNAKQKKNIREFAPPAPNRVVRLVYLKNYPRKRMIEAVTQLLGAD